MILPTMILPPRRHWISLLSVGLLLLSHRDAMAAEPLVPAAPGRELAIELGAPFHDNMILQRGMKVPVWGWGEPGVEVSVEFAGQRKAATAGQDGRWSLDLDPMEASFEPAELVVEELATSHSPLKRVVINNVLVGEVWMCSGQSNMQWPVANCNVSQLVEQIRARVEAGEETQPVIREAKVTNLFSALTAQKRGVKAEWSSEWEGFSGIAFAFAYELAREVQVPVGILNCSFSTTKIEAWIPREGFADGKDEYTQALYRKILQGDPATPQHKRAFATYYHELRGWANESGERVVGGKPIRARPRVPGNLNGNRDACWMANAKINPMAPYAIRGAIWNQGYASQNDGIVYRNNLHSLVRGWRAIWNQPDLPVYSHQFYGKGGGLLDAGLQQLSMNDTAEMRLGTWLAHKEIPNTAMASQIDIVGGVHYWNKTVPGQRLALHALKKQYPLTKLSSVRLSANSASGLAKDLIVNGPMYRDYTVEGDQLILELDHAEGLRVGQQTAIGKGFAHPVVIPNGEDRVKYFFIADKSRAWHRAAFQIKGETLVLTAPGVTEPCGVAYGSNGVGEAPGIYNKAMLPLTPFIFYDHKLVVSRQWDMNYIQIPGFEKTVEFLPWPDAYLKVAGVDRDPTTYGLQAEHRKLCLLSPQFTHHAVIQAGMPIRFYGEALPNSVVTLTFAGITKQVSVGEEQDEWEITVPSMEASAEPRTLHVVCTLDGMVAHERTIRNVVIGEVWYVGANAIRRSNGPYVPRNGPAPLEAWDGKNPQLRVFQNYAMGTTESLPSRFKMNASGYPQSRYFPRWSPTFGFNEELANRIHTRTGHPVGIILMNAKKRTGIKDWVGYEYLKLLPDWKADVDALKPLYARDPQEFMRSAEAYIHSWQAYWQTVQVDPARSGALPVFPGSDHIETSATMTYNQLISAFSPGNFKAILCLTGKGFMDDAEGVDFGPRFAIMANCWKETFARSTSSGQAHGQEGVNPHFVYVLPSGRLAPALTRPAGIMGRSTSIELDEWIDEAIKTRQGRYRDELLELLDTAVNAVYEDIQENP
ncbi:MAG: hypothetical protein RRC34_09545 [Lentisphaeria bacterium]|nr:hypothetical protein [Lentisphaeria bacterium]